MVKAENANFLPSIQNTSIKPPPYMLVDTSSILNYRSLSGSTKEDDAYQCEGKVYADKLSAVLISHVQ